MKVNQANIKFQSSGTIDIWKITGNFDEWGVMDEIYYMAKSLFFIRKKSPIMFCSMWI